MSALALLMTGVVLQYGLSSVRSPLLDAVHVLAHMVIFGAYVAACFRVPQTIRRFIYLRPQTLVAGAGFFVLCGITHVANAFGFYDYILVHATDSLQAVSIILFLVWLMRDYEVGMARFERALVSVGDPTVAARLLVALRQPEES